MIESLVLDALLLLILVLLIPIGVFRGGIREGYTSAGLLLGVALAAEWAVVWGDWIADHSRLAEGAARFLIATGLLTLVTVVVGYASAAAFAYRPGPGGRLYGALLAALNGVVFLGYVFDYVITFLFDGDRPALIENSYIARALAAGTGVILLIGGTIIGMATLFGLFVRERDDDEFMGLPETSTMHRSRLGWSHARRGAPNATTVDKFEPEFNVSTAGGSSADTALTAAESIPVQIRQVRHWEREPSQPALGEMSTFGWSETWPADSVGPRPLPPWAGTKAHDRAGRTERPNTPSAKGTTDSEVLRRWLRQDGTTENEREETGHITRRSSPEQRPRNDE